MQIQERLLLEQLQLLGTSELGRRLLGGRIPTTVEEFRQNVPLTTYTDYADCLSDKREDVLPVRPQYWLHTSGRTGQFQYKWVPYTPQMVQRFYEASMAPLLISSCTRPGEFVFEEGDSILFAVPPFPYISGVVSRAYQSEFNLVFLPRLEVAEKMEYADRVQEGFRLALKDGIDVFYGGAAVLLKISEQFAHGKGTVKFSPFLLHPRVLLRLLRGLVRSRLAGRSYLMPRDLWTVKCIVTGGTDVRLFSKQIEKYWGRPAFEGFGCTEGGAIGTQLWNFRGMVFFPDLNYFEFIPEADAIRSRADASYTPRTVTLAEVQPGRRYELVFTNFNGGVFTRYRIGDIIEIVALRDEETGVDQPQWVFYSRADDIIDLAGFSRLTEVAVWQAMEATGAPYVDWTARKEYEGESLCLHLYLEPKDGLVDVPQFRERMRLALKEIDSNYADMESMLGIDPLRVTLLSPGTFKRYILARQAEGVDLAQFKPAHMNISDSVLAKLMQANAEGQ